MKITTNSVPRQLYALADLPEKDRADFDYIEADAVYHPRMFRYKGQWYDTGEFMRVPEGPTDLAGWDGYATGTVWCGTLIRLQEDGEKVIVGQYRTV